jgi:hypothetical protein
MEDGKLSTEVIVSEYKNDVERMAVYIPWLEKRAGKDVASIYAGDDLHLNSVSFPVYDSTLLTLVNELSMTVFMDQNYRYAYSRNRIKTVADELKAIERVDIRSMNILCGILSKYVIGGMTKGVLWSQAVEYHVFLNAIKKAKEVIDFWDRKIVADEERTMDTEASDNMEDIETLENMEGIEALEN